MNQAHDWSDFLKALRERLKKGQEIEVIGALRARVTLEADPRRRARLEYLLGHLLIQAGKEVEGTFAIERALDVLTAEGLTEPELERLRQQIGIEG